MKKSSKDLGISKKISLIRKHFGLSADALGEKAGVSGTAIANIEKGESLNPGAEMLASISTMLGINLNWLLLGEGEMLKTPPAEDTGTKIPVVSAQQWGLDIPISYEHTTPVTHGGRTVPTFRAQAKRLPEPPGTDLVRQVAKNTREIELLQEALATVTAELRQLAK